MIKSYFLIALGSFFWIGLQGQALEKLSLSEAYDLLEKQYPILQNEEILQQIHSKDLQLLDISKKPTLLLNAEGRLQSESPHLETEGVILPFEIDLPLVSAKSYVEAQYLVWDGGIREAQRKIKQAKLSAGLQNFEIQKYGLQERINQLFLGIVLIREHSKLLDISLQDLKARQDRVVASVEFGVVLESELTKIKVKELQLNAQKDQLGFQLAGLVKTLSTLINTPITKEIDLVFPSLSNPTNIPALNRPEQQLFKLQEESILAQSHLIEAARKPKLSAFAQAGVGYPNPLNLFDNAIAPYAVLGAKFSWKITDWKRSELNKEMLSLQALQVHNAAATFEFNLQSKESKYLEEVKRLQNQIENDHTISKLQAEILTQMAAQLDEGVITSSDYLTQLNAELAARQNIVIHEIELLKIQLDFWNERKGREVSND